MHSVRVNKLAVLLCVLVAMLTSYVWYTIFEANWMAANQITGEFLGAHRDSGPVAIAFISHVISFYIMAWLFIRMNVRSGARGAVMALLMAIAFYFVVQYTNNAFAYRPNVLSFIDGGIVVINWTIAGAILGSWKKYKSKGTNSYTR